MKKQWWSANLAKYLQIWFLVSSLWCKKNLEVITSILTTRKTKLNALQINNSSKSFRTGVPGQTSALQARQTDGYRQSLFTKNRSPEAETATVRGHICRKILNSNWLVEAQCRLAWKLETPRGSSLREAPTFCPNRFWLWRSQNNPPVLLAGSGEL